MCAGDVFQVELSEGKQAGSLDVGVGSLVTRVCLFQVSHYLPFSDDLGECVGESS